MWQRTLARTMPAFCRPSLEIWSGTGCLGNIHGEDRQERVNLWWAALYEDGGPTRGRGLKGLTRTAAL
jgi:hypothetical protein